MKIGTFAAFSSPQATPEIIEDFGRGAEDLGLDSVWVGEHVVLFDTMEFPYPGSRDGKIPMPENGGLLDTVATLAFLAGNTKALRLGTGITLLPQRNPIYTAKEFTTLDWLSGGRIELDGEDLIEPADADEPPGNQHAGLATDRLGVRKNV